MLDWAQKKYKMKKNSTTLRVRKLSPTLLLTKPSVPYLSCSDEKEIFKLGVAVPMVNFGSANLILSNKTHGEKILTKMLLVEQIYNAFKKLTQMPKDECKSMFFNSIRQCSLVQHSVFFLIYFALPMFVECTSDKSILFKTVK